ncbi:hypothetical protein BT93_L1935 [Corymbia citriodora subsp. variegata]|uniref:CCHC-type domain-containing protein n=1 Tax=Corymbia citriodora subsp. variegata TaxID=360336 RepID=A0A8T0CNS4_CORYI|nr:hypothetical protein BT93_L1935 [Corymbia citriodora subsp. variegata]
MLNSMESTIVDLVTHIDTVKELWEYLDVLYSGQNNMTRVYELSQEFYRFQRKGRPITQYFAEFKKMYEELNALLPISTNVQQMRLQREQLAVMGFLGGLGSEYEAVRSQILGGETIASLPDTFARVLRVSREPSQDTTSMAHNSALVSQSRTSGSGRSDGGNRGGYSGRGGRGRGQGFQHHYGQLHVPTDNFEATRTCHHCGKPGHIKKFCYKLHGRPVQQQLAHTVSSTDSFPQPTSSTATLVHTGPGYEEDDW